MGHFEGCCFKPDVPAGCDLRESRILLHCCCAPCSTAILEWMVEEGLRPGVFFSNSNIVPLEEYAKRRDELARYAASFGLEVVDDEYSRKQLESLLNSSEVINVSGGRTKINCHSIHLNMKNAVSMDIAQMVKNMIAQPAPLPVSILEDKSWV